MASNAPSYPEMPFTVLFFLKTALWTQASSISTSLGCGWVSAAEVPLLRDLPGSSCWERLLEPPTLWGFGPRLGKKLSPCFSHHPWVGLGCFN